MMRDSNLESNDEPYYQDFNSYQYGKSYVIILVPGEKQENRESQGVLKGMEIESVRNHNDYHSGRFTNQIEFWLTCLGFAVGYGNIWRFPYMLYRNGGGTFLIPWAVCIVFIVLPISYLEVTYGQLYRRAIHRCYDTIHPRLIGLGFAVNSISGFITIYYMTVVAWCMTFFLYSFRDPFPWAPKEGDIENSLMSNSYFEKEFLHKTDGLLDIRSYSIWMMISMVEY